MNINYTTRQLIRSCSKGYLSTEFNPSLHSNSKISLKNKFPYSTFTLVAYDYDSSPIFLLSDLSEHTTNLKSNNLISLMVCEEEKIYRLFPKFKKQFGNYEDPMSRPRITLIGEAKITKDLSHKKRFLFNDMNFYILKIKSAHLIGGFAQVRWFNKSELLCKDFNNFKEMEFDVIEHMNSHHKESIDLYSTNILKNKTKNWKIIGIDPDGFDLRKGKNLTRLFFEKQLNDAKKLRGVFVNLHKLASKT